MTGKIIQITTAERGWHLAIGRGMHEVACWGLTEDGEVVPLVGNLDYGCLLSPQGMCELLSEPEPAHAVFSPVASWRYATSHDGRQPDQSDWELCSTVSSADGELFVWRTAEAE